MNIFAKSEAEGTSSCVGVAGGDLLPVPRGFMRRYFRIEVSGEGNIPTSGPFILAPTHRSRWDPFMLYCAVSRRILYFMTSHDEVVGLQGWIMRRMGVIPINTQRPSPSVIRSCTEMIAQGEALVIFPEGNLFYYKPGEVHPLKPGVAWLALKFHKSFDASDLPIIPVRLIYGHRRLRPGSRAKIVVGEPISVSQLAGLTRERGGYRPDFDTSGCLGRRDQSSQFGRIPPGCRLRLTPCACRRLRPDEPGPRHLPRAGIVALVSMMGNRLSLTRNRAVKADEPGAIHKRLNDLAGSWDVAISDRDHFTLEWYCINDGGMAEKVVSMTHTRKKP